MTILDALARTPNLEIPALRGDERYELPLKERMRSFGLGCVCPESADRSGLECPCAWERRMDFVNVENIIVAVTAEVPVYSMTQREYEAWFMASEIHDPFAEVGARIDGSGYVEDRPDWEAIAQAVGA